LESRRHLSRVPWIVLMLAAAVPQQAVAQDQSRVELAGGYAYMHDYDGDASFPRGWFASIGADVAGPVALVGEASGSYKSMDGLDVGLSVSSHAFVGGPRVVFLRTDRVAPYAQMLFGIARTSTVYELPEERLSSAQNNFAMAPGGGIDIRFSERAAFRLGANFRLIRSETFTLTGTEPYTIREFLFIAGVAFR
jgi:outer membrane protein with beta-barrel domain